MLLREIFDSNAFLSCIVHYNRAEVQYCWLCGTVSYIHVSLIYSEYTYMKTQNNYIHEPKSTTY